MPTIRLTMAEAILRYLAQQQVEIGRSRVPLFGGVFAIFGHGNVAGMGPALHANRQSLPTLRAHNEQAMAMAAIAYAKTHARRRMMACTSSVGPGATNMVTAAAVAHLDRLPVLFLPGDIFASRRPDPVLQQVEDFGDGTISANDCFKPVSRYWDRLTRPEQILECLPQAIRVLTDPVDCGPVTLALPQDVQAESYDYPREFFRPRLHRLRRPEPDRGELADALMLLKAARRPLVIAGGGVKYSQAERRLADLAASRGLPVGETQAGKGSLAWDDPANVGAIGVTGAASANQLAAEADVVLAVGTRLSDFTTGSRALFRNPNMRLIQLNVGSFDSAKHGALPLVADAERGIAALGRGLGRWKAPSGWTARARRLARAWWRDVARLTQPPSRGLPSDGQVLGAVNRAAGRASIMVCAAGGLPGELHKLWRAEDAKQYHLEYGFSCMGYEIAGGLGAKLAAPEREVYVLVGDGSYLMLNSEIATSVALGAKLIIVLLDNRGFGCIHRLQQATGGARFNNLLGAADPDIDFVLHARSLGAQSEKVADIAALEAALARAKRAKRTSVIVIDTDPHRGTAEGGAWWDVPVGERTRAASDYRRARKRQRLA
ncbi:MAG: 3D-(3,5/4)-trihydroxycyclohexane-1,2-dione acylhydrolase (decyclizing) [Proteobacteria bacterium]|nr:3D-(3,5/4)-trihydroxycyclohexane-1,2-dione acylhydrolase (decyclizing) [Pseudomonadota bacterium]MBI3498347.1 3D-(3,5/4)-trihydroxycyclohexane-1,2-dione acylhydrolase (decyclizing) [Pseudomonadota bacterium]